MTKRNKPRSGKPDEQEREIALEPGFEKPAVGTVVKIEAVDWGGIEEEVSGRSEFTIVHGTIYGKVVTCNDQWISVAFQVFASGNLRGVLSIPWVCISKITILEHAEDSK